MRARLHAVLSHQDTPAVGTSLFAAAGALTAVYTTSPGTAAGALLPGAGLLAGAGVFAALYALARRLTRPRLQDWTETELRTARWYCEHDAEMTMRMFEAQDDDQVADLLNRLHPWTEEKK